VTAALVPYREERRSGSLVRYLSGGVAVDIRVSADGRKGALRYSMRLAAAKTAVAVRLYGVEANGDTADLGALDVAPFSIGRSSVPLPRSERSRYESVYLELVGDDLHLVVEAPKAPKPRSRPLLSIAVMLAASGVAAVGGGALAFALPQPPAFSVPSTTTAGVTVRLPYTTHGIASWSFAASLDDGSALAAGPLKGNRGEIALALPPRLANRTVTVHMRGSGIFGVLDRVASFPVTPVPPARDAIPSIARVGAMTARRERLGEVETVLASYLAVASSGKLSLLDRSGKVVATAPFSHGGTQRLTVPSSAASSALSARLDVRLGSTVASAMVGLPAASLSTPVQAPTVAQASAVVPPPLVEAPPQTADAPEAVTPADDKSTVADDPFVVLGTPVAGQPVRLAIRHNFPGMQLRLEDDAGTVIDEAAVASSATSVVLHAPAATTARTYYITATYGSESGQEVVVRSVRVSAR
jgi:hypothetical protein